ncbi:MAG: MerR family transcriptional regulator [Phycisphaerales bacterium]|nr:MerR family transcriptional regulator [Phycisphaerales bacterium]
MRRLGYSSQEVCRIVSITNRQLQHWDALGIAGASLEPAAGSGTRRRFAPEDLLRLAIARELRRLAVGLETVRSILISLPAVDLHCSPETCLIWTSAGSSHFGTDADIAQKVVSNAAGAIRVNVGELAAHLRARLSALPEPAKRPPSTRPKQREVGATSAKPSQSRSGGSGAAAWGEAW